jgi:hypothetical protein
VYVLVCACNACKYVCVNVRVCVPCVYVLMCTCMCVCM